MSVVLTIAGQTFDYPTTGDDGWGEEASNWALAVSTQLLQRTGGSFSLTNDVNFGASFATIQTYLKSRSSTIASAGFVRMAKGDSIQWRNNGDGGNIVLAINGSDEVTINGTPVLLSPGGILTVADGGTGFGTYSIGDLLYASGAAAFSKLGIGTNAFLLKSTGTAPSWGLLLNANVDASAAIARTKLASGTINHVVINDGSGIMSSEAQLAGTRGGTGVSSTATFPTSGVVVTEAASETLTNKTLTTPIINESVVSKVSSDSPYTIAASNYLVLNDCTAGVITNTLPAASTSVGKIYKIKKTDSTFSAVTIARAGSDTIIDVASGLTSTTLNTQGEEIEIFGATSSTWQVISRRIPGNRTSYTPTVGGLGTGSVAGAVVIYWRGGSSLFGAVAIQKDGSGGSGGANVSFTIPSGLTIDTSKNPDPTTVSGPADRNGTITAVTTLTGVSTSNLYFLFPGSAFGSGQSVSGQFVIPIAGWNG